MTSSSNARFGREKWCWDFTRLNVWHILMQRWHELTFLSISFLAKESVALSASSALRLCMKAAIMDMTKRLITNRMIPSKGVTVILQTTAPSAVITQPFNLEGSRSDWSDASWIHSQVRPVWLPETTLNEEIVLELKLKCSFMEVLRFLRFFNFFFSNRSFHGFGIVYRTGEGKSMQPTLSVSVSVNLLT